MKKILGFILALALGITTTFAVFPAGNASATTVADCQKTFLGLRPWYSGLVEVTTDSMQRDVCTIKSPGSITESSAQAAYFWTIILNISADVSLLVGYVAIIFVVYGGYKYILSNGEPGKVAMGKTILTNALIGLVIAILATVIVNTILMVIGANAN